MSSDYEKAAHEKAVTYLNKFMSVLDDVEDGMMKAHEFIGHVHTRVDDVFDAAQDGIWKLSEKLDEYRTYVWDNAEAAEREVYGDEPKDGCPAEDKTYDLDEERFHEKTEVKSLKPTDDMSRQEKVSYLINGYGLDTSQLQDEAFAKFSDASLTMAVNILRRRNNQ